MIKAKQKIVHGRGVKCFFIASSRVAVKGMISDTQLKLAHPHVIKPHRWCADMAIYQKSLPYNIGYHGSTGLPTNQISVIVRNSNQVMLSL